ncbi:hypothetical protein F5X98DRAFT_105946 [Xylaria grammica]|nr:hypothetical protein F5X98DRAFT_105946 [Xylaria grammica]
MRKAHQPNPDPPAPRSRSDSFVRMLELEKMCKMNRILRDHGSSTSTSNTSRASFPSVTTNPPASRSRRASDYPPLSHQTQIMKAVRRSAALPSLSLSIPPSPAPATMKSEGSVEELSLAREERAKTVTFSEPEDEEVSDDSSICQSPSWEQYSQKKKQRKKGANQKSTKEKEETAPKKRSNRLTKSAPTHPFTIGSLTASDRSISAPDLGTSIQTSKMNPSSLMTRAQVALDKHQTPGNEPSLMTKDKRKSKGFLSGFKIQHGNVAAVQKLMEARKGAEKGPERGADEDEPLRSIQYETIPVTQPITARHGIDQNTSRPRKPPSIRSVISTSDHSLSSQEKRSSGARTSTSLGHGRSQSLLSSTLNKLRGPSYLYYQPSGDDSSGDPPKHSDGLKEVGVAHGKPIDVPNDQTGELLEERGSANSVHPQLSFDFAFSPRLQRMNTEPGPEIAPRGRQPRLRKVEIQSPDLEQDVTGLRPSSGRRVQIEVPQVSTRDTVMAMVDAQEKQSQAAHAYQQTRSNLVSGNLTLDHLKGRQRGVDFDGKLTMPQRQGGEIDRPRDVHAVNMPNTERLHEKERKLAAESNQNDRVDISNGHVPEDDEISVDTYASTIRPTSHQNISRTDDIESHAHATVTERLEVRSQTVAEKPVVDLITFERDVPDTLQQPLQPHREVDYFASFSDSYLPPVLNLRSLRDGKFSSPRLPSPEESDEDSELHGHFLNDHTKKRAVANGREQIDSHATGSHPQESGRILNEQKPKNSPATSTQYSDSDVPAFERLGLSSKAAKILVGAEMASTSTAHSQQTNPSRTTSERSSSSICDDSPPSPSSATTPDSSRPQSRKGVVSQSESSQTTLLESTPQAESVPSHQNFRSPFGERFEETALGRTNVEVDDANIGDWSKVAITLNPKQQRLSTPTKAGSLAISSSLVTTPTTLVSFANVLRQDLDEEGEQDVGHHPAPPLPPRAQSALDLRPPTNFIPQSSRPQRLHLKQNAVTSSVSLPSSPPADLTEGVMPRKSALKMSRNNSTSGPESSTTMSVGAAYLQEARKAAPVSTMPSSRGLRPHFSQKNSSGSIRSAVSAGNRAEPLAKMLVECCNCHFFHDMPSRVYECMAKPDSVVEDKSLGVSAAITTMVRCPWCAHGMTTQCCSGYAAVVYLKEKLHGK